MAAGLLCIACEAQEPAEQTSGINVHQMDPRVRPGDDFFGYANGGWLTSSEIPAEQAWIGTFPSLREEARERVRAIVDAAVGLDAEAGSAEQKIADLYRAYTDIGRRNARAATPLQAEFDAVDAIDSIEKLADYFARANTVGLSMPIDVRQIVDWQDPAKYTLLVTQGGLGLPDRDYYLNDDQHAIAIRKEYAAHIAMMFELAGQPAPESAANTVVRLETHLASAQMSKQDARETLANYRSLAREELPNVMPVFAWDAFLETYGLPDADRLVLYMRDYLAALDASLEQTSLASWKIYLKWKNLNAAAALLDDRLDEQNFAFYGRVLSGTYEQRGLAERGAEIVNGAFGDLIGEAYVNEHFSPAAKARAEDLVANLLCAYEANIRRLDWLDEQTREAALDKLGKITSKIGYPGRWRTYPVSIRPDDLLGNLKRIALAEHKRRVLRHYDPVDREEWALAPQSVNAYYSLARNEIVFPAAILQPPLFDIEADDAVNYGAIGAIIGHEIGHALDDQGSRFDGDGRLRNWWTDEDRAEFDRRAARLVDQYAAYRPLEGLALNGELTLSENLGDLGGISIAVRAYRMSLKGQVGPTIDGFTGPQRLFIGFARAFRNKYRDEYLRQMIMTNAHAPARYRINGSLRNLGEFYEAFDVTPGDAMYLPPEARVGIW